MAVKPIPEGYHTVTPYMLVKESIKFIEFLTTAFGAKTISLVKHDEGTVLNAEIKIGNSMVMVSEAKGNFAPMPAFTYLYVKDTDEWYNKAMAQGAESMQEPEDMYYGDRNAGVKDAWGNVWWIATHFEDVSDEEMVKRSKEHK